MSAGTIITVLTAIPWGKVIENAPKVADAAVKLWDNVAGRKKQGPPQNVSVRGWTDATVSEVDPLHARVLALEENTACLQDQMQESTALIKALAEQNAQFVQRVELNRRRFFRFAIVTVLAGVAQLGLIIYLLGEGNG